MTPDEVLADPLPEGIEPYQVTSVVVIVEYLNDEGEPLLWWKRDTKVGIWRHLGMTESVVNDIKNDLSEVSE